MTTCMTVVCLITVKQDPNNKGYVIGSGIYCATSKNYKDLDFKFYNNQDNTNIQPFSEGDVVTLTGKFSYCYNYSEDNSLFVSFIYLIQSPLDITK